MNKLLLTGQFRGVEHVIHCNEVVVTLTPKRFLCLLSLVGSLLEIRSPRAGLKPL